MTGIMFSGTAVFLASLIWGLVAGASDGSEDDDEKQHSGLLEDDE